MTTETNATPLGEIGVDKPEADTAPDCPQCRSTNTESTGPLSKNVCSYCGNEWADIDADTVESTVSSGDQIRLPSKLKQPLEVAAVDGRTLELNGNGGATYRLSIRRDTTGQLKRKKEPSERNQFGSRWTNYSQADFQLAGTEEEDD